MKNQIFFSKVVLVFAMIASTFVFSQAKSNPSLANTEWKGVANVPNPAEVNVIFAADTVDVVYQGNSIEKMAYSFTENGSMKLTKISGVSPCKNTDVGLYTPKIENKTLTFVIVNDECAEREDAFDGNGYKKVPK